MPFLLLAVLAILGYLVLAKQKELFCIAVRSGKPSIVRGQASARLLQDFAAAVRHVDHAEIRAHKTQSGARLSFSGHIDADTAQRLRNIFGLYPASKLRSR